MSNIAVGMDISLTYWAILGIGFLLMFSSFIFDDLFHFGHDGAITPVIAIFMILFGSIGGLGRNLFDLGVPGSLALSGVSSTIGAAAFYFGVWRVLKSREGTLADRREDIVGKTVEVSLPIPRNGLGQITYTTNSGRTSAPARSLNGEEIRQGEAVEVVESVGTTYVVKPAYISGRRQSSEGASS